jgi:hypothetical protein
VTFFRHEPGTWDQPEVRDAWRSGDPRRVHGGEKGILLFTFYRNHDAGFLQQVQVRSGDILRLTAWAHAWSNFQDGPHPDDPYWSEGPGREAGFVLRTEDPPEGSPGSIDDWRNFAFQLGIDPTGDTDPYAETVAWGAVANIYNEYAPVPPVEVTAQADVVTVFLRSKTLWTFKHNDAYWDDAALEMVGHAEMPEPEPEPEPTRGQPREQYERTYVLLPPGASEELALAVVDATWDDHRYTFGGSADDAGIGDLDTRRVIAINPEGWPGDLRAFFEEHYPGVRYTAVTGQSPEAVMAQLMGGFTLRGVHDRAGADWLAREGLTGWCLQAVYLGTEPVALNLEGYANAGVRMLVNLRYSYATDDGGQGTMPGPERLPAFEEACVETMRRNPAAWAFVYGNEMNNPREYPRNHELTPGYYAESYNQVWAARPPGARMFLGAIDPFNPGWGDWRESWRWVMDEIAGCDGLAMHAYTHGPDLSRIWGHQKFGDAPLTGVYYDLRVLESQMAIVPTWARSKPVVVTETNHFVRADGEIGWMDVDGGEWARRAYEYFAAMGVAGACLFRFNYDGWRFGNLPRVLAALKAVGGVPAPAAMGVDDGK